MTHFATLKERSWNALCGADLAGQVDRTYGQRSEPGFVHGTLSQEADITCPQCRRKWKQGMTRVRRLFRSYRGEE